MNTGRSKDCIKKCIKNKKSIKNRTRVNLSLGEEKICLQGRKIVHFIFELIKSD